MVDAVISASFSYSPKYMLMVPFANFSAVTHARVELLLYVDGCHRTLGPRTAEEVAVILVVMRVSVTSRIWLEFKGGSKAARRVAFAK